MGDEKKNGGERKRAGGDGRPLAVSGDPRFRIDRKFRRPKQKPKKPHDARFQEFLGLVKLQRPPVDKFGNPVDPGVSVVESSSEDEADVEETPALKENPVWTSNDPSTEISDKYTSRLAILGADWDSVSSRDLLILLSSFAEPEEKRHELLIQEESPEDRKILKVSIHPTFYGLERMEFEKTNGPRLDDEGEDSAGSEEGLPDIRAKEKDVVEMPEKLRQYEKQKSRYHFAIAECDSPETARILYEELDGFDAAFCVDFLELQFVADDFEVPTEARDSADGIGDRYDPPPAFATSMRHTKAKLTWDLDDPKRRKLLRECEVTRGEWEEDDLRAYIGSETDSADDESRLDSDGAASTGRGLPVGLLEILKEKGIDTAIDETAVVDAPVGVGGAKRNFRTKAEEYRKLLLGERSEGNCDDAANATDDFFIDPLKPRRSDVVAAPPAKCSNKSQKKEHEMTPADVRADLELLVAGSDGRRHFSLHSKKSKQNGGDETLKLELDIHDNRFSRVLSDPTFALDATSPKFKDTQVNRRIAEERRRKRSKRDGAASVRL